MGFRHIVVFRFHEADSVDAHADSIARLRSLQQLPGVLDGRVERSIDARKGTVVVQNTLFEDAAAFARYQASDRHQSVAKQLALVADWLVADYVE